MKISGIAALSSFLVLTNSLIGICAATENVATLDRHMEKIELDPYLAYIEDPEGKLSVDDVASGRYKDIFIPNMGTRTLNFGYTRSAYWIRIELVYAADDESVGKEWLLEIGYPVLDDLSLFVPEPGGSYAVRKTGDTRSFENRDVRHHNFLFKLWLEPNRKTTLFLRAKTEGSMQIPVTIWSSIAFAENVNVEQIAVGIYYGIMLVMPLYNLFLFFSIRDRNYIYYVLFISGYAFVQLALTGLSFEFFWGGNPWWGNRSIPFFIGFSSFWGLLFSKSFLKTKENAPVLDKIIIGLMGVTVLTLVLSLAAGYSTSIKGALFLGATFPLTIMAAGVVCFRRGYRPARFLLLAWFSLLGGIFLYNFMSLGILPNMFITEHGLQIGSALEVILLSLGLADRINIERKEKLEAREKSLKAEQDAHENLKKAEMVKAEYAKKLEREVEERTRELNEKTVYLENILESSADGIGIVDRRGKFIMWNQSATELFGYDKEDASGRSAFDLYADKAQSKAILRMLRSQGYVRRQEVRLLKKNGSEIPIEVSIGLLKNEKGQTIGSVSVTRDLSEIKKTLAEVREAWETAEAANKKIMESIEYARKIQKSLLEDFGRIKTWLPRSFVIWEPRDVVGGDMYYTDRFDPGFILAVIDCTGHGVPGALMTMIASSGLKKIIKDEGCHDPADILKKLNVFVKTALRQDTEHAVSDDGLDAAVVSVRPNSGKSQKGMLTFAGARLPIFCLNGDSINMIRGDRESIGYRRSDMNFEFANHIVEIEDGMSFYIATDGFLDQLGGEKRLPFGKRRFKNLLVENAGLPFEEQREILLSSFKSHMGEIERMDDMTVVGFGF